MSEQAPTSHSSIKMICFDFDGTLADTMPWLESKAVALLMEHTGMTFDAATNGYRRTTGLPFDHQVELINPGHPKNKLIVQTFDEEKISKIDEQELFPETVGVFKQLKEKGYLITISSSTKKEIIEDYMNKRNALKDVDEVGKHHNDYLMEKYKLSANQLLYCGDSLKDMERSHASKIGFVGRLGPMFTESDFVVKSEEGVVSFPCLNSLDQLLGIIEKVYGQQ